MKTSVDIPERELQEVMRHTGARTKREAVVIAISEFNRRRRLEALCEVFGTFDSLLDGEALERARSKP